MKIILTAPVEHLGVAGDVVEVKDGYGRNFLLPQHKAIKWTRGAESQIEGLKRARDAREVKGIEHAAQIRDQILGLDIKLTARSAEGGKLFGAVTVADIALAIKKAGGPSVDKRQITVVKPIKTTGKHFVDIRLHEAVSAHTPIQVVEA